MNPTGTGFDWKRAWFRSGQTRSLGFGPRPARRETRSELIDIFAGDIDKKRQDVDGCADGPDRQTCEMEMSERRDGIAPNGKKEDHEERSMKSTRYPMRKRARTTVGNLPRVDGLTALLSDQLGKLLIFTGSGISSSSGKETNRAAPRCRFLG